MLHLDGFEQYANENPPTNALLRADYSPGGTWAMVAGRGRTSRAISGQTAFLERDFTWATAKMSLGFAGSFNGRGSMCSIKVGALDLTLWLNPDTGLPNLNTTIGGALPTKDRFYFYEIEIDRATGACALYVNGRQDCVFQHGAAIVGNAVKVRLGYRSPSEYRQGDGQNAVDASVKVFDDLYIRDSSRMGAIMITTRFPTADVKTEWFTTEPSHHAAVSKAPPQPLDSYVASDTIGKEDSFTSNEPLQNTNPVIATGVVVLARKSPTLNAKLGVKIAGSVTQRSATRTVESGWRTQFVCFDKVDADTIEGVQNSQFGITVASP